MKIYARIVLLAVSGLCLACGSVSPPERDVDRDASEDSRLRPVSFTEVRLYDRFWGPRLETNRTVTIPHIMRQNEETGRVDNFRKAAGSMPGSYEGRRFNDTDIYKIIEAASYALAQDYDAQLDAELDELIELIAAAQSEDGYLFPAHAIDPTHPAPGVGSERWLHVSMGSHELYNAGHLIEAAVAHFESTRKRNLLDVAVRFADLIDREFGSGVRRDIPGHEEIELALVKLSDLTGDERFLSLARFFIDERGREHESEPYPEDGDFAIYNGLSYKQDHQPVVEQRRAAGHAVRATYLYTGMADVAMRTEAPGYRASLEAIWQDVVSTKLYLTGGLGSRATFESFGEDYELPNASAYAETCAAIGNDLWNHRMFLATGEPRFLDVMERVLYNGALSGVSLRGDTFFYTNPLESSGERDRERDRSAYFTVACCPANLARLLARLPGFVYAQRTDEIFVGLFAGSEARIELESGTVRVIQETDYPWDGTVRINVYPEAPLDATLHVRIPGWARETPVPSDLYVFADERAEIASMAINDEDVPLSLDDGFATVRRTWRSGDVVSLSLPMPVRRVRAHPSVEENVGKLALQRGPLVYVAESVDNDGGVRGLVLPLDRDVTAGYREDLLGGVVALRGTARREGRDVPFTAIPYFAWANRGPGEMVLWIPAD
jgi:DUF1680 family protein